mgnify:CR=1 FL=1
MTDLAVTREDQERICQFSVLVNRCEAQTDEITALSVLATRSLRRL